MSNAVFSPRDRSRTTAGKSYNLVRKHTKPPRSDDEGLDGRQRWGWLTIEMMESPAFRTLSSNATRAFFRLLIEHNAHGALENGRLTVTHGQFADYGVTREYVADAIDELAFKGWISVKRGRAGIGTPHASAFTLTYVGDWEGAPPTNEWRRCTEEKCLRWSAVERKIAGEARARVGRKKKTPVRKPEILPVRDSEILRAS